MSIVGSGAASGGAQLLPEVLAFSSSLPLDRQLLREDVIGSLAHLIMLSRTGIVPREAAGKIRAALVRVLEERPELPDEEDVHMAVETLLARELGETAGMLHTARSRNDQVALDLRLHVREQCALALAELAGLIGELASRAEEERETLLPGYTHRQRAQPVSAAYYFCAWGAMFARDPAALQPPDELPLGVGALGGTSLPIDREEVRKLLRFGGVTRNGLDTVGDRDFALDFCYAAARALLHASRIATDVIDFSTAEFGYVRLDDDIAMGSSMMPQKRNPDLFELIRGKCGRAVGNLTGLMVTVKGLPGGYNRDLQEDRQPLLETGPLLLSVLRMLRLGLPRVRFDKERARAALGRRRHRGHRRGGSAGPGGRAVPHRVQAHRRAGAPVRGGRRAALARAPSAGEVGGPALHGGDPRRRRCRGRGGAEAECRRPRRRVHRRADRGVACRGCGDSLERGAHPPARSALRGTEGGAPVKRDFLAVTDLSRDEHRELFRRAAELKARRRAGEAVTTLAGRSLLLLFEKASTRTRISFEAAIGQLGGNAITLPTADSQIARGETLEDTARVASRYVDAIMFRTHGDDRLRAFARAATVPVINGLSDGGHPVQILADLFTVEEKLGSVAGKTLAFVGDCASNMALSFCEAAPVFAFKLRLAAPEGYRPPASALQGARVTSDPQEAVAGADVVITDVFVSMGQEKEAAARMKALSAFRVDEALLARAHEHAIVLHCLPAHRGEEISAGVLEGEQSAVFDEAENRLHVQKALLEKMILG